ncbi:SWIM zinc finger family protein [Bryobacter aggregatus]|uniref:SWIM zinc finger family protein n=1 Tax=Bryobacter aggregatus TaxID=360054 RepID=UPI0004E1C4F0|nr:SWIM zinc finger family protein [Bryobacter aggregatus]
MRLRGKAAAGPAVPVGDRWIEWIEAFPMGPERHSKGKAYAENGAVLNLESTHGVVEGSVLGSRPEPYQVSLEFAPVDRDRWAELWRIAAPEDLKAFQKGLLTAGMERSFEDAGIKIFPERYKDVKPNCDCPDWMRPCKHALAVLRVLGVEIARNPLVLTKLRGDASESTETPEVLPVEDGEALRADPAAFWGSGAEWQTLQDQWLVGGTGWRLLKRLGPVAVYGVRMDPDVMFKPVYDGVAAEAAVLMEQVKGKMQR